MSAPQISVVIPAYDDSPRLALVLAALELQDTADAFEVIVADDGSEAGLPDPGARPYPVAVVGHTDLGNRTGPARNLGAARARGELLVFLDADTVPEPRFLREIAAVCDRRHLTVGRRRHADLSATDPARLRAWLAGTGDAPPILPEPAWLADAYRATDDLRRADLRSYRYVISAVLACPRRLFERIGGFAEELVGYGGEDWEFARRAWLAGADLRHAPLAVAWHDGPDLAGRASDVIVVKNAETLRIAELLTDPQLRGRGLIWQHPRVVVRCGFATTTTTPAAAVACAEALLAAGDIGLWTGDGPALPVSDPRIHRGMPGAAILGRAEQIVDLQAPVAISPSLLSDWQRIGSVLAGSARAASPRDLALGLEPSIVEPPPPIAGDVQLERWFERTTAP